MIAISPPLSPSPTPPPPPPPPPNRYRHGQPKWFASILEVQKEGTKGVYREFIQKRKLVSTLMVRQEESTYAIHEAL